MARGMFDEGEFLEVFVDTPLEVAEQRDVKGLYAKARAGKLRNLTGIDSPYEAPVNRELRLSTVDEPVGDLVERLLAALRSGYARPSPPSPSSLGFRARSGVSASL